MESDHPARESQLKAAHLPAEKNFKADQVEEGTSPTERDAKEMLEAGKQQEKSQPARRKARAHVSNMLRRRNSGDY